jgi:hypothetical protein
MKIISAAAFLSVAALSVSWPTSINPDLPRQGTPRNAAAMPDIREWGCKADNITDDGPCFQAAYDAQIGPIHVPGNIGVYKIDSPVVMSSHPPFFVGDGWTEHVTPQACPTGRPGGTWVHISNPNVIPFQIKGPGTPGRGGFFDIAFCQDHSAPGSGWTPTIYKPLFTVDATYGENQFENLYLYGIYDGFSFINNAGRFRVNHIRGQTFHNFLSSDNSQDGSRADDIHIWPYWSADSSVTSWQIANGVVFHLYRVDGLWSDHLFAISYKSCMQLDHSTHGAPNNLQLGALYCDFARYPLWITGPGSTIQIANLVANAGFLGVSLPDANCIEIEAPSTTQIGNFTCHTSEDSAVNMMPAAAGAWVSIGTTRVLSPNHSGRNAPIFNIQNTNAGPNVLNLASDPQITLMRGTETTTITPWDAGRESNGIFEWPGGYYLSTTIANGGSRQMPSFLPASYLFMHATGGPIANFTVHFPSAAMRNAVVSTDVAVATLRVEPGVGDSSSVVNCPKTLPAGKSFSAKWVQFGVQRGHWECYQ